jgi:hypothetical protein
MKKLFALPLIIALATFCSCQKQITEEEIKALVKREVQQQLAAEQKAQEQERDRRRAELNARRNALLGKEGAAVPGLPGAPTRPSIRDRSGNPAVALPPGVERLFPRSRFATPMPAASVPPDSETSATPSVTPANSESPPFSSLSDAPESVSPTPSPESSDETAQ